MFYNLFKDYLELKAENLATTCFINDGKGNFTKTILPDEIQLAPVFAFAPVQKGDKTSFIAAGNFYGVIPYEGRYDALLPGVVNYNMSTGQFEVIGHISFAGEEVRDIRWISTAGGKKILAIAQNNNPLLFVKQAE